MSDDGDRLTKAVRKYVAKQQADVVDRYRKNLTEAEYRKNIGRDEALREFATFFQEQVRRMNDPDAEDEKDE